MLDLDGRCCGETDHVMMAGVGAQDTTAPASGIIIAMPGILHLSCFSRPEIPHPALSLDSSELVPLLLILI